MHVHAADELLGDERRGELGEAAVPAAVAHRDVAADPWRGAGRDEPGATAPGRRTERAAQPAQVPVDLVEGRADRRRHLDLGAQQLALQVVAVPDRRPQCGVGEDGVRLRDRQPVGPQQEVLLLDAERHAVRCRPLVIHAA